MGVMGNIAYERERYTCLFQRIKPPKAKPHVEIAERFGKNETYRIAWEWR